jgi:hypothetical protein
MTRRLYCADIVKCNDFLYEDDDTLIAYAIENPDEFIGKVYEEIISVDTEDGLRITYTMIDDYDENDNEILKTETETFDIEYTQMMVTVPDIRELFKSA